MIGGFLIKAVGTRPTYQIFAAVTFFMGVVYFFFNILYLQKHQVEGNDIVKKKPKKIQQLNGIVNTALDINEKNDRKAVNMNESAMPVTLNNIGSMNDKKYDSNNGSNELKIIQTTNIDNNKNNKKDNSTVKTDIENQHDR